MIKLVDVSLAYPNGTQALSKVNLTIGSGELVYIVGPSGSGKTSLLKLLLGIEYANNGIVEVLGCSMSKKNQSKIRKLRRCIGPIFQEFRLIKGHSALENVMMGMRFIGMSHKIMKTQAQEALVRVGLSEKSGNKVDNLSYGERQRVAIARAIARNPKLILADEPTGNLDKENALNILELLSSFANDTTSVVITTHATHLIENHKGAKLIHVQGGTIEMGKVE